MELKPDFGPRINYQAPGKEGGGGREDELLRGEGREYFYVDSNFVSLLNDLRTVSRKKLTEEDLLEVQDEGERNKIRNADKQERENAERSLEKDWERLMHAQLIELQAILDNQLLRFKSPYPYDSRRQEMWFDNFYQAVQKAHQEAWPEPGTSERTKVDAWLMRITVDSKWGESSFKLVEGLGTVLPNFYDGKKMMQWVSMPVRTDPITAFYEGTFARDLPGLKIGEEERAVLPERAKEGLRERAVRYQDENTYWRMAVASVHQIDHDDGRAPLMEKLTPIEEEFIKRLFIGYDPEAETDSEERLREKIRDKAGSNAADLIAQIAKFKKGGGWLEYTGKDGFVHRVPSTLLNLHSMPFFEDKKRKYFATMEVLLTGNIRAAVAKLAQEPKGEVTDKSLDDLVKKVQDLVQKRVENWHSPTKSLDEKLAGVVARMGIIMDWGHMASSDMSWGWDYKLDLVQDPKTKKWELKVIREMALGGPTSATDANTPALWRVTEAGNQRKTWSKGFLPPMSADYIGELRSHAPDWKPKLEGRTLNMDPKLQKAWDRLWSDDRAPWDPKMKVLLGQMVWYWETPIEDPKILDSKGQPLKLIIPFFFPPTIDSLNFWNTISLAGGRQIKTRVVKEGDEYVVKEGSPTVWNHLRAGGNMSELDWEKMGDQALYRWMITIGQTIRYVLPMLDSEMAAGDQIEALLSSPAALKEFIKRADLGERDEKLPMNTIVISLVPLFVVLREAQKHGIWGAAGQDQEHRTAWARDIAQWIAAFRSLPGRKDEVEAYGEYMAKMTKFYTTLIGRIGVWAGLQEKMLAEGAYNRELMPELKEAGAEISSQTITNYPAAARR